MLSTISFGIKGLHQLCFAPFHLLTAENQPQSNGNIKHFSVLEQGKKKASKIGLTQLYYYRRNNKISHWNHFCCQARYAFRISMVDKWWNWMQIKHVQSIYHHSTSMMKRCIGKHCYTHYFSACPWRAKVYFNKVLSANVEYVSHFGAHTSINGAEVYYVIDLRFPFLSKQHFPIICLCFTSPCYPGSSFYTLHMQISTTKQYNHTNNVANITIPARFPPTNSSFFHPCDGMNMSDG